MKTTMITITTMAVVVTTMEAVATNTAEIIMSLVIQLKSIQPSHIPLHTLQLNIQQRP